MPLQRVTRQTGKFGLHVDNMLMITMPEEDSYPEVVELPLEDVLDLHSFPPKEIKALLQDYLDATCEAGFPEVRIIHGKGIGVQREIVRSVASKHPHVASVRLAPEGWGASIVVFKRRVSLGEKKEGPKKQKVTEKSVT